MATLVRPAVLFEMNIRQSPFGNLSLDRRQAREQVRLIGVMKET